MKKNTLRFLSVVMSAVTAFTFAGFTAPTTVKAAGETVAINATNFPDEYFRNAVSTLVDLDKNGSLDADEIANVTDFTSTYWGWDESEPYFSQDEYGGYFSLYNASDVTGIEYFTNLSSVYLYNVNNISFDFSKMANLGYIYIDWCYQLREVNITGLKKLYSVVIDNCDAFMSLDVSTNTDLGYVSCAGGDSLSKFITGKNNKNLSTVYVYGPALKSLDLSKLSNLQYLAVCDCNLSLDKIGIKNKNKIKGLYIRNNKKSGFVPSDYKNLEDLEYSENGAKSIDVSKNKKLTSLNVRDNSIKSIDVSGLKNLWSLDVSQNKLSKLDVSKNKNLGIVNCSSNGFRKLDFSKNKYLYDVNAYSNPLLDKIDFSKCSSLYSFYVDKDVKVTIPKDSYKLSYWDYEISDYKTKKLKSNTFTGQGLDMVGSYVTFEGKNNHYIYGGFSY